MLGWDPRRQALASGPERIFLDAVLERAWEIHRQEQRVLAAEFAIAVGLAKRA